MKKIFVAATVAFGALTITACDRNDRTTSRDADDNKVVVDRDSVATEFEVTETVVEYDTTQRTKTIKRDDDRDRDRDRDNDIEVRD